MASSKRRLETLLGHIRAGQDSPKDVTLTRTGAGDQGNERVNSAARNDEVHVLLSSGAVAHQYQYTRDNPLLTPAQRDFYEENGFLVIRRLVNQDDLDHYASYFRKLCCNEVKVRN